MPTMRPEMNVDMGAQGIKKVPMDLQGNSHKSKKERQKLKPVVTNPVTRKKKGLGGKIADTFFGDDIDNVGSYLIHDVIVPGTKNIISDLITGGLDMIFYGESRGRHGRSATRDKNKSYVRELVNEHNSYAGYYNKPAQSSAPATRNKANHNFDDIELTTRAEANEVLLSLQDVLDMYGVVTVADFYELVNIAPEFTDHDYGWSSLARATVVPTRRGYVIKFPRTERVV